MSDKIIKSPQIRFSGFIDEWEQNKLENLSEFSKGNGYTKNDLRENGVPIVLYGRLYTKYETVINNVDTFVEIKEKSVISEGNEVVVPASGESAEDIARASVIGKAGFILGGDLNIIKPKQEIDSTFLALSISNGTQQKEMSKRAQGKSVVHLHNSDLKEVVLSYPGLEEQKHISDFFTKIDDFIILHKRKLELLKEMKKSMLKKMLPKDGANLPEIRFEGFKNPWEEKNLTEVSKYRNGKAHEQEINDNGEFIVVNSKFVSTNGRVKKYTNQLIEPLLVGEIAFVLSDVPNGKALARTFLVGENGRYSLNQRIAGITPHNDTDPYYLTILMNRNKYFLQFDSGVGQTNLSKAEVENFTAFFPSYEEQRKIGLFFGNIDRLINLQQQELNTLELLKKTLLKQMFL